MTSDDTYDSNDVLRENRNMWRTFADECQARAYEHLSSGDKYHLDSALKFARHAEAARWQATGESQSFDLAHDKIN